MTIVVSDVSKIPAIRSQISLIIRANWSNPPAFGARIVSTVLSKPDLRSQWLEAIKVRWLIKEIKTKNSFQIMSSRIKEMRKALQDSLEKLQTPGTWNHITQQIGMFSYTGLNSINNAH